MRKSWLMAMHAVLFAVFLAALCPAASASAPLDLRGYLTELSRSSAAIQQLGAHPSGAEPFLRQLPDAWSVKFRGQDYSESTEWLRSALNTHPGHTLSPAELHALQSRLHLLESDARDLLHARVQNPDAARATLNAILQGREFRNVSGPSWIDWTVERIERWIASLISKLFGITGNAIHIETWILWGVVATIGFLLIFWLVHISLAKQSGKTIDLAGPIARLKTWRDWLREAAAAARSGDYRNAICLSYWAAVSRLTDAGAWQADWSRTPRERLRLLQPGQAGRASLAAITRNFERTWYGTHAASAADYQAVASELEKLGCR